ncbi:MAG: hypothetical protein ACOCXJ_01865 [Planctomycetota bacterium]
MPTPETDTAALDRLSERFEQNFCRLEAAPAFAKANHLDAVLDLATRLLASPGGPARLATWSSRFESAGLFRGTDWERPALLKPRWVAATFRSDDQALITLEGLSELRLLAIAQERLHHPEVSAEHARHQLTRILAFNLQMLMGLGDETTRELPEHRRGMVTHLLQHIAGHIGVADLLDPIVEEVWRIQRQRPLQVEPSIAMIDRLALCIFDPESRITGAAPPGAERLISALYGPTQRCREDPGLAIYGERIASLDPTAADDEAQGFARSMHDTGLVSPYHVVLARQSVERGDTHLLARCLGLSSTGNDCLHCYRDLVCTLVQRYIDVGTHQALYGLAMLLERAVLYQSGIASALWRQMTVRLHPAVVERLGQDGAAPALEARLLSSLVAILGQPLGVAQGNNPACQATRAISIWAAGDPAYLLQLVFWATRDDDIVMHFEGERIASSACSGGLVGEVIEDLDPISHLLVPHLDRIYIAMGQRVATRGEDPHRWINPEFHGWQVHRGCALAVDVATQRAPDLAGFVRRFLTIYHPLYNGNAPVVHPQPAGIAITDSHARFIGWHAITILRVALDHAGVMRVYFFNPNMDSGQDWGAGVVVAIEGHGEQYGESSLPITEFASRLYLFHYDETDLAILQPDIPDAEIAAAVAAAQASWAVDRG